MTVKELIEKLEKIENKDAEIIFAGKSYSPTWVNEDKKDPKYVIIG